MVKGLGVKVGVLPRTALHVLSIVFYLSAANDQ